MDATDGRVYALTADTVVASSGAPCAKKTITLHATLAPGRYVLLAATEFSGAEGGFGVCFESTAPVSVIQLNPSLDANHIEAARSRNSGSAGEVIATSLFKLTERLSLSVEGAAQKTAAQKTMKKLKEDMTRRARKLRKVRNSLIPAGVDSSLSFAQLLERSVTKFFSAVGKHIGVAGISRNIEVHLDKANAAEAAARQGAVSTRYGLIRAQALLELIRKNSRAPLPSVPPPSLCSVAEARAHREREEKDSIISAVSSAAGSAGDPEIAILMRLNDSNFFRHSHESVMPIPGMEIVEHLPVNLSTLAAPLLDEAEEQALQVQQLSKSKEIAAYFKELMKNDADRSKKDFELTLMADGVNERAKSIASETGLLTESETFGGGDTVTTMTKTK